MKEFLKKIKVNKIAPWIFLLFVCVYDELLLHFWTNENFTVSRFFAVLLFSVATGLFLSFFCTLGKTEKADKITALVMSIVFGVFCLLEFFIKDSFNTFMSLRVVATTTGDVAGEYSGLIFTIILRQFWRILIVALPIIAYFITCNYKKQGRQRQLVLRIFMVMVCLASYFSGDVLSLAGADSGKYTDEYNFNDAVQAFGLATGTRLDVADMLFGHKGSDFVDVATPEPEETPTPDPQSTSTPAVYGDNVSDIDFNALAESTSDKQLAAMHSYVASQTPSKKNEYTGLFKGKNLIFVTAEAFSKEVIDPNLTPTLYRLATKGINFTDYYQPAWGGSTSSGEYSNLIGLVPTEGVNSIKKTIGHNMYYTLGNQFTRINYTTLAYHNNSYTYYDRNKTHENLGYSKFMGMGNGMEQGVKKMWPESDQEMIDFTLPQYINKQPFCIYYMSVSGHCRYTRSGNSMSSRNYDKVKDMNCSETLKCYYAANLELEFAMRDLVAGLEEAGIADDTVIVIGADHYPYGLDKSDTWDNKEDYLAELYGYTADTVFKRDHSGLIIWSGSIEDKNITVTDPVYSLDLIPTLSNLFGLEYDSRMLVGRDVFSNQMPLALWMNYSWKTDKGTFDASKNKFTPADGVTVDENYVKNISAIVKNKIKYSKYVLQNDYYGTVFGEK